MSGIDGAHAPRGLMTGIVPQPGLVPKASVTIETVTTLDGIAALGPSYERLLRVTGNSLPFATHQWHLTWCKHFLGGATPQRDDSPLLYVIRNAASECVAIIPFIVSRRRMGPVRFVFLRLIGVEHVLTEIRAPVIESGYEYLAVRAMRESLNSQIDWDWIHWTGIGGAFEQALRVGSNLQYSLPLPYYVLDLAPTWEEFRAGLKRNIRESLRHCYNSLKRDGLAYQFEVLTEPLDVRPALDRFIELHAMRAALKGTVVHPNRFAEPLERDFLYAVCERMSVAGSLRLFCLRIGGEVVAMRIGFLVGDSLYLYYSGYHPNWGRYSVMTTTVAESIKYAIGLGLKTVNLSPGNDVSKTRWGPRELPYSSAYELRERLRSRLARGVYVTTHAEDAWRQWGVDRLAEVHRHAE